MSAPGVELGSAVGPAVGLVVGPAVGASVGVALGAGVSVGTTLPAQPAKNSGCTGKSNTRRPVAA